MIIGAISLVGLSVVGHGPQGSAHASSLAVIRYPVGILNPAEPSGMGPPGASALAGYTQAYVNDFTTRTIPTGWDVFTGIPGGDPGGRFGLKHLRMGDGLMRLLTYRDPSFQNRWVTGGVCQCGISRVYGAYFVRSRITGAGPNEVELLWPYNDRWPPEIDFNETGATDLGTTSTVHYGSQNLMDHRSLRIDMTRWHTWGVIWTASVVTYIVDGAVWASVAVPSHTPRVSMRLDFEQRALCSLHRQCPTVPVAMYVDWVDEYVLTSSTATNTTTTRPTTTTTSTTTSTTSTTP